jgi:hypothetical protein
VAGSVSIIGLRELQGSFKKYSAELSVELTNELKIVAEPVRRDATTLALGNIRNIGGRWAQMRTGSTRSAVYVAPRARRRRGSPRPNLAPLLLQKAMEPALDQNTEKVYRGLEVMLDRIGDHAGF